MCVFLYCIKIFEKSSNLNCFQLFLCFSLARYCATWAKMGECQANPNWMLKNCKVACGECKNKCADYDEHCATWKKQGECKKNPEYMNIYCAESCGKCQKQVSFYAPKVALTHN